MSLSLRLSGFEKVLPCFLGAGLLAVMAQAEDFGAQKLVLHSGESRPVGLAQAYDKLVVSDPTILAAAPVTSQALYVRALQIGTSNILAYDEAGQLVTMLDIRVTPDLEAIEADLNHLFPQLEIELNAVADRVHIRGSVTDPGTHEAVLDVVRSHVQDRLIDALEIDLPAQVLLEVRFVEAARKDIREFGFGSEISRQGEFSFLTGASLISGASAKTAGTLFNQSGPVTIDVFLEALEEQGVLRTLAEPNLVSRSGETASFLAGGEFPVPVAADNDRVTIEFKNFGVGLEFTPTVLSKDRIILDVTPEVSGLNTRNSVRLANIEIPSLSVRKLTTQIEIGSGESFAIAGLLQNDFQSSEAGTPFLSSIPILGALFRSSRFKQDETELVVIITPHLVKPVPEAQSLSVPVADFTSSDWAEDVLREPIRPDAPAQLGASVRQNILLHQNPALAQEADEVPDD